ncbi:hypothetical protein ACWD7F_39355, partial [Streptomyces sp. NPDC005122]
MIMEEARGSEPAKWPAPYIPYHEWVTRNPADFGSLSASLGVNDHAVFKNVGEGIAMQPLPSEVWEGKQKQRLTEFQKIPGIPSPYRPSYHFASAVAKGEDGKTFVTLENRSRRDFEKDVLAETLKKNLSYYSDPAHPERIVKAEEFFQSDEFLQEVRQSGKPAEEDPRKKFFEEIKHPITIMAELRTAEAEIKTGNNESTTLAIKKSILETYIGDWSNATAKSLLARASGDSFGHTGDGWWFRLSSNEPSESFLSQQGGMSAAAIALTVVAEHGDQKIVWEAKEAEPTDNQPEPTDIQLIDREPGISEDEPELTENKRGQLDALAVKIAKVAVWRVGERMQLPEVVLSGGPPSPNDSKVLKNAEKELRDRLRVRLQEWSEVDHHDLTAEKINFRIEHAAPDTAADKKEPEKPLYVIEARMEEKPATDRHQTAPAPTTVERGQDGKAPDTTAGAHDELSPHNITELKAQTNLWVRAARRFQWTSLIGPKEDLQKRSARRDRLVAQVADALQRGDDKASVEELVADLSAKNPDLVTTQGALAEPPGEAGPKDPGPTDQKHQQPRRPNLLTSKSLPNL